MRGSRYRNSPGVQRVVATTLERAAVRLRSGETYVRALTAGSYIIGRSDPAGLRRKAEKVGAQHQNCWRFTGSNPVRFT